MFDITMIMEAGIALLAALMTAVVIPYIQSKTSTAQQEELSSWIKIAVTAAEQLFNETGMGEEKKTWVLTYLENLGVTIDTEEIDGMIEAMVYELSASGTVASQSVIEGVIVGE